MSPFLKLGMILALIAGFYGLHTSARFIVESYGLLGAVAACALFYVVGVVIDRGER